MEATAVSDAPPTPRVADPPAVPGPPRLGGWVARLSARLAIVLMIGGLVLLLATRWDGWLGARRDQTTDDAYVRGDITALSAKVDGYVRAVAVGDFQPVKAGDVLIEIEDDDYRARVAQAEADVTGAEAAIENLKARKLQQRAQIAQAESAIVATAADVERTRLEADRAHALLATAYGTPQRVERAVAEQKRFQATLMRNRAQLDAERSEQIVLDTQEAQLRAALKAKRAALDLARITLGYTRIVAPIDGMVSERQVRAGQYVRPGTLVISVVPLASVWVVANYKETQLGRVVIGQPAGFTVDGFPDVTITGRVDSIAPASGAQFSLLPPDNATGNFTKVVQRIPVKIVPDAGHALAGRLRPGMSVTATIHTDPTAGAR